MYVVVIYVLRSFSFWHVGSPEEVTLPILALGELTYYYHLASLWDLAIYTSADSLSLVCAAAMISPPMMVDTLS